MNLKTYQGNSMADALEKVKAELDEQADTPAVPPSGDAAAETPIDEAKEWARKLDAGEADMSEYLESFD